MTTIIDEPELADRLHNARKRSYRIAHALRFRGNADQIEAEWDDAASAIPKHAHATLDEVDQEPAVLEQLIAWAANPTWALFVTGDFDAGKTFAAVAVAYETIWLDTGLAAKITTGRDLLAAIKPGGGSRLDVYSDAGLLLIDGLSEVELSKWDVEQVKAVLLDRYEHNRPTIVTTNLDPAHIARKFGQAVWTRLQDGAVILTMNDTGRRANRGRFTGAEPVTMLDRIDAQCRYSTLPDHLKPEAIKQLRHKVFHPAYTAADHRDLIETCDELLEQWQQRIGRLRRTLEPLIPDRKSADTTQSFEWFADAYRIETGAEFTVKTLHQTDTIDDVERIERLAAKCWIDLDQT